MVHVQVAPLVLAWPQRDIDTRSAAQAVSFGRVGYALAWAGLCGLHGICAAYLLAVGRIYAMLHTTLLYQGLMLYQLTLGAVYHPTVAGIHFALASIHCYLLLHPLTAAASMVLLPSTVRTRLSRTSHSTARRAGFCGQLIQLAERFYGQVLGRDRFFGFHGAYFELFFLARQVVETALQTYQAYTMSRLLPRVKLNGFYTLILVINCWATPLLRRVCHRNKPLERLLVVLCDILLDFVSSIAVPVAVAIGYFEQYDPVTSNFAPWSLYYNDVWLINFLNEMPLLAFGSWVDAASRLVFSLGLLSSMDDVKAVIQHRRRRCSSPKNRVLSSKSHAVSSSVMERLKTPELQARISKWAHSLMVVWGFGIAIMHVEANVRALPSHCSLPLRPWLVSRPACAIVTIDCRTQPGMSGAAADFEAVYSQLDAGSVEYVVFRHCPKVEFTPRLLTFHSLYGVKTHNSTIAAWNLDAACTTTAHPHVRFAFMSHTQFPNATLPLGLRHEQFPGTLMDIEITVSNIQWIPSKLPWPRDMLISIEFSQLDEFPLVLYHVHPRWLSLAFNHIATIPTEAIMTSTFARVHFRGNPIEELPESGVEILEQNDFASLSLEYTNITTLPPWVTARFLAQVPVFAAQTPLCLQILQNTLSAERESWLRERPWLTQVQANCGEDSGPIGLYPLEVDAD